MINTYPGLMLLIFGLFPTFSPPTKNLASTFGYISMSSFTVFIAGSPFLAMQNNNSYLPGYSKVKKVSRLVVRLASTPQRGLRIDTPGGLSPIAGHPFLDVRWQVQHGCSLLGRAKWKHQLAYSSTTIFMSQYADHKKRMMLNGMIKDHAAISVSLLMCFHNTSWKTLFSFAVSNLTSKQPVTGYVSKIQ